MTRQRTIVCVVLITTLLPALATVAPIASADAPFTTNVRVNPDTGPTWGGNPGIAVDATGVVWAVWQGNVTGDYDIYFAKSGDRGTTWTEPSVRVNADAGTAWQGGPVLAWGPSGALYAVWQDDRNGDKDLYFARSTDGGATWTDPDVRVNSDATATTQHQQTLVVDADDNLYAAWSDRRNGDDDIYFAKSTDGGATWTGPDVRVNTDTGAADQISPFLAFDTSGALVLAWSDNRNGDWAVWMARSTDGGATWTDPNTRISADAGTAWQARPALAAGPASALYAVWQDNRTGDYDIYFARSTDGGATWTAPSIRVNTDTGTAHQESPELALDPSTGTIYVVWHDGRSGDRDIYFASSTDGGASWLHPNVRVNDDVGSTLQWLPQILRDPSSGRVYVTWTDYRAGHSDVFLAYLPGPDVSDGPWATAWVWVPIAGLLVIALLLLLRRRRRAAPGPRTSREGDKGQGS